MRKEELAAIPYNDPRLTEMHRRLDRARESFSLISDAFDPLLDAVEELVTRSGTVDLRKWRDAQ
jgi:hypothetical protein